MVWIDYKKAFDSLPHSWVIEVLKVYNVCPTITEFIKNSIKKWRTKMCLHHEKGLLMTDNCNKKRNFSRRFTLCTALLYSIVPTLSTPKLATIWIQYRASMHYTPVIFG